MKVFITKGGLLIKGTRPPKSLSFVKKTIIGRKLISSLTIDAYQKVDIGGTRYINLPVNSINKNLNYIDKVKYEPLNVSTSIELKPEQVPIFEELMRMFDRPTERSGCVLKLEAGNGKTFISVKAIEAQGVKTLIVVPNSGVCNNWLKVLRLTDANVGVYSSKEKRDGDIVVMVVNSLMMDTVKFDNEEINMVQYLSKFGFVIYDEVHNYTTEKRVKIFWRTCFRYRLGLSATPEYSGEFEPLLYLFIGDKLDGNKYIEDVPRGEEFTAKVYSIIYKGPREYTEEIRNEHNNFISAPQMVKQMEEDPYRHGMVMSTIRKLHTQGRNIIVFAEHLFYCRKICQSLIQLGIGQEYEEDLDNDDVAISVLVGGANDYQLDGATRSDIVIVSYAYGKEGLSYDHLDTLIMATPRRNKMEQIIGRIFRNGGDKSIERIIVDITDTCSKNFITQRYDREKLYKERGYVITRQTYEVD